jgi:hypothetical protein
MRIGLLTFTRRCFPTTLKPGSSPKNSPIANDAVLVPSCGDSEDQIASDLEVARKFRARCSRLSAKEKPAEAGFEATQHLPDKTSLPLNRRRRLP